MNMMCEIYSILLEIRTLEIYINPYEIPTRRAIVINAVKTVPVVHSSIVQRERNLFQELGSKVISKSRFFGGLVGNIHWQFSSSRILL